MASTTVSGPWPSGTLVKAYPAAALPAGATSPSGTALSSGTADAQGRVELGSLEIKVPYVAVGANGRNATFSVKRYAQTGQESDRRRLDVIEDAFGPDGQAVAAAPVQAYDSGNSSELVTTLPVATGSVTKQVVYSVELPADLAVGDVLVCMAEMEVTNDLGFPVLVGSQIVQVASPSATDGIEVTEASVFYNLLNDPTGQWNMHHGTVVRHAIVTVADATKRFLNFTGWAASSAASPGDTLTVEQDYGRLQVLRLRTQTVGKIDLDDAHVNLTTEAHGGIVSTSDARLSNARTPVSHRVSHEPGGADELRKLAGSLRSAAAQSVPNNTETKLTFDTVRFDHNQGTVVTDLAHSQIVIPQDGVWLLTAFWPFVANGTGDRRLSLRRAGSVIAQNVCVAPTVAGGLTVTRAYELVEGHVVEAFAFQTSGGALNTSPSTAGGPLLEAVYLGTGF